MVAIMSLQVTRKRLTPNLQANSRIHELAKCKQSKRIWLTDYGPRILWGNQDTIRPLSRAALRATTTDRLDELAVPKKRHSLDQVDIHYYSCGRNSSIWKIKPSTLKTKLSERIKSLAVPKSQNPKFEANRDIDDEDIGRESSIWKVSKAARSCKTRPRTAQLARAKNYHSQYIPNQEVMSFVSKETLKATASDRINQLSKPKVRKSGNFFECKSPESPIRNVPKMTRYQTHLHELINFHSQKVIEKDIKVIEAHFGQFQKRLNEQMLLHGSLNYLQLLLGLKLTSYSTTKMRLLFLLLQ